MKRSGYFECTKCGELCMIDGDFPKFFCYCDVCHDYAQGFDDVEHVADCIGAQTDHAEMILG